MNHINELILPRMKVVKPTAKIGIYDASNLRIVSSIKSPEGKTPVVKTTVTQSDAYILEEHALKILASDKDADNQDKPFDVQKDAVEYVTDLLSVSREYGLFSFMAAAGNFTNKVQLSGTAQWGDSADDPVGDINIALQTVADEMGVDESLVSMVLSKDAYRVLAFDDDIKDNLGFKYNSSQAIQPKALADAFGCKEFIIGSGIYNSAEDGQTDVLAKIWSKHAWAVFIPNKPKLKQNSFGYTIHRDSMVVDKWYNNDRKGWWVRNTDEYDAYILNEKGCYFIEDAIA